MPEVRPTGRLSAMWCSLHGPFHPGGHGLLVTCSVTPFLETQEEPSVGLPNPPVRGTPFQQAPGTLRSQLQEPNPLPAAPPIVGTASSSPLLMGDGDLLLTCWICILSAQHRHLGGGPARCSSSHHTHKPVSTLLCQVGEACRVTIGTSTVLGHRRDTLRGGVGSGSQDRDAGGTGQGEQSCRPGCP